jgi:hypothetical protein
MPYDIRSWPKSALENERGDLPEKAGIAIDVIVRQLQLHGVELDAYNAQCLGKEWNKLWRLKTKVVKEQIRVLCKPYGRDVVVIFRIFKKVSKAVERRAYGLAKDRSLDYEREMKEQHGGKRTIN